LLIIKSFISGALETNTYLVVDKISKKTIVIDPCSAHKEILEVVENDGLKLVYIVNTHGHEDHVGDNKILRDATKAKLAIHELDAELLEKGALPSHFNLVIQRVKADLLLKDGDVLKIGSEELKIIHTPGHTPGSICLYNENNKMVFTGDLLFAGSHGRTDLEGGDDVKMTYSLKKIALLPKDTKVFPGHGEETSIGREKWLNDLF
jgi:glyoxylase-like metal-dependent hydrolase (beta-lactamase superfamily II)